MVPPILYYVMDPMCSWCWGFRPVLEQLRELLPAETRIRYVMGGLAPDTEELMPAETCAYVQSMWRAVTERCGAEFNPAFWDRCRPRRSTWPACRAVLAGELLDPDSVPAMILAIQQAYYLHARNPSERETLIALAGEIGLQPQRFATHLDSAMVQTRLQQGFDLRRRLGADHFPSLLLEAGGHRHWLTSGYADLDAIRSRLQQIELQEHR